MGKAGRLPIPGLWTCIFRGGVKGAPRLAPLPGSQDTASPGRIIEQGGDFLQFSRASVKKDFGSSNNVSVKVGWGHLFG